MTMQEYKIEQSEQEKEKIINDSLPFIKYTAYRLAHRLPPQLSVSDLISVGIMGLLDALQRYTEGRVKLNTFVEHRIKGAMLDELRSHDWVPRSLKTKIGQIRKAHRELEKDLGRMPNEEEIAGRLSISLDEYYRTIQNASNAVVFSFEDFRDRMHEESDMDVTECIPDPDMKSPLELLEESSAKEALARLIERLPDKEKLILSLYYWDELTMKEIGKIVNLTEGRVCQLHNQALIRLKSQMTSPVHR
jgi:RNA polymerase sigma factor for flagellar operon FliA